jgi:hypothetical protein
MYLPVRCPETTAQAPSIVDLVIWMRGMVSSLASNVTLQSHR